MTWRWLIAVFTLSFAVLAFRAVDPGLTGAFVDPVGRIAAQDEALYSHGAIRMAEGGEWLTPRFLDRLLLVKPPLFTWLAAASIRAFGISTLALRLPSLLSGAAVVTLLFAWAGGIRGPATGAAAAMLLLSNPLWQSLSRLALTDALLAVCIVGAVCCLAVDPALARRRTLFGFAVLASGAILAKSVAGLLPLLILAAASALLPPLERLRPARWIHAAGLVAAITGPWFVYQLLAHPQWFWAEFVQVELIGFGAGAPPQTSQESNVWFYLRRLWATDPVLCACSAVGVAAAVAAFFRDRSVTGVIVVSWIALSFAATVPWGYRNLTYLGPLIPALCLAACFGPLFRGKRAILFAAALFLRAAISEPQRAGPSPAAILQSYCERGRSNELILVDPDDQFYATLLPLPRVRYLYFSRFTPPGDYGIDFHHLGVTVDAAEFLDLPRLRPAFAARLRQWGLTSGDPTGSVIVASHADLARIVEGSPQTDFLLPAALGAWNADGRHEAVAAAPGRILLLAKDSAQRPKARHCRL